MSKLVIKTDFILPHIIKKKKKKKISKIREQLEGLGNLYQGKILHKSNNAS